MEKNEHNEYDRMLELLNELGIEVEPAPVTELDVRYHAYPAEWLGAQALNTPAVQYVFNSAGRYVGLGWTRNTIAGHEARSGLPDLRSEIFVLTTQESAEIAAYVTASGGGSVSEATLVARDILESILRFLGAASESAAVELSVQIAHAERARDADDEIDYLLEEVTDALSEAAPDGMYFGSHPGDGADFGFWWEEQEERDERGE